MSHTRARGPTNNFERILRDSKGTTFTFPISLCHSLSLLLTQRDNLKFVGDLSNSREIDRLYLSNEESVNARDSLLRPEQQRRDSRFLSYIRRSNVEIFSVPPSSRVVIFVTISRALTDRYAIATFLSICPFIFTDDEDDGLKRLPRTRQSRFTSRKPRFFHGNFHSASRNPRRANIPKRLKIISRKRARARAHLAE